MKVRGVGTDIDFTRCGEQNTQATTIEILSGMNSWGRGLGWGQSGSTKEAWCQTAPHRMYGEQPGASPVWNPRVLNGRRREAPNTVEQPHGAQPDPQTKKRESHTFPTLPRIPVWASAKPGTKEGHREPQSNHFGFLKGQAAFRLP